jgi:hypothetical protein
MNEKVRTCLIAFGVVGLVAMVLGTGTLFYVLYERGHTENETAIRKHPYWSAPLTQAKLDACLDGIIQLGANGRRVIRVTETGDVLLNGGKWENLAEVLVTWTAGTKASRSEALEALGSAIETAVVNRPRNSW